jgi:surface polysaccharide O-acyltransferase-like enzyme
LNQEREFSVPVDLVRTVAIVGVLLLHAANDLTIQQMNNLEIYRWTIVDIYQSIGRIGVPLFVLLTGALLLQPSKLNEPIGTFFKKRWLRIGLPFIFWGATYFAWDYFVDRQINQQSFSTSSVIQGILNGPYYHFWYLYMLVGLYLFTPILRIVVAHAERNLIKYIIVVWFFSVAVLPLLGLFGPYYLDSIVLTIPEYVGFFLLGAFLLTVQKRSRSSLAIFMTVGLALTAIGTYALAATVGGGTMYFFQQYISPTMILASVMLFLLLNTVQPPIPNQILTNQKETKGKVSRHPRVAWLLHKISENTLPIFLFHVIILECLQKGYFGFTLNGNTLNSIIGVPIAAALTLFICLGIIIPLKKVPILKRLIG